MPLKLIFEREAIYTPPLVVATDAASVFTLKPISQFGVLTECKTSAISRARCRAALFHLLS